MMKPHIEEVVGLVFSAMTLTFCQGSGIPFLLPLVAFALMSEGSTANVGWTSSHPMPTSWTELRTLVQTDAAFAPSGNFSSQPHVPRRLLDDLLDPREGKVLLLHTGRCGTENLLMQLKQYGYISTKPAETLQTASYDLDEAAKKKRISERDREGLVKLVTERLLSTEPKTIDRNQRILTSAKMFFAFRRRLSLAELLQAHWNAGYRHLVLIVRSPIRREVSSLKAKKTHVFTKMHDSTPCESVSLNASVEDMSRYWELAHLNHASYGEALQFPLFRKLLLSYDYDLYTDSRIGLMQVLDFLGHPASDLSAASATRQQAKLNDCPLSVTLSNYGQISEAFRDTFHERFLEDQTNTSLEMHRYLYALCQSTWKASHRYGKYADEVQEATATYNELVGQKRTEWGW